MSIATEITRLEQAKAGLKSFIDGRGVAVPEGAKLDAYPALMDNIPMGPQIQLATITIENSIDSDYWFIDYNDEHINPVSKKYTNIMTTDVKIPIGTYVVITSVGADISVSGGLDQLLNVSAGSTRYYRVYCITGDGKISR